MCSFHHLTAAGRYAFAHWPLFIAQIVYNVFVWLLMLSRVPFFRISSIKRHKCDVLLPRTASSFVLTAHRGIMTRSGSNSKIDNHYALSERPSPCDTRWLMYLVRTGSRGSEAFTRSLSDFLVEFFTFWRLFESRPVACVVVVDCWLALSMVLRVAWCERGMWYDCIYRAFCRILLVIPYI